MINTLERHNASSAAPAGVEAAVSVNKEHRTTTRYTATNAHAEGLPIIWVLAAGMVLFFAWAAYFQLDQTVRATGQVIPSARTQVIQVADGGVLASLKIEEGQRVEEGQLLAVLEKNRINASYQETLTKVASQKASLIRARAEARDTVPVFGEEFEQYPAFVNAQRQLYQQGKFALDSKVETLETSLKLAKEELRMNEVLFKAGDSNRLDVMRSKREVSEIEGSIIDTYNEFKVKALKEVSQIETELASTEFKLQERQSVLDHTNLKAPMAGVIKHLKVNTVGGVLRQGDELLHISPTNVEMIVEIRVNPIDIGDLIIGQEASVKLDAFDSSVYGALSGELIYISSDTLSLQEERGQQTYYIARIKIDEVSQKSNPRLAQVSLKPGMTTSVDIRTGQRSVLRYLMKPLFKTFDGAFNQR